jgi:hypothetical protein
LVELKVGLYFQAKEADFGFETDKLTEGEATEAEENISNKDERD